MPNYAHIIDNSVVNIYVSEFPLQPGDVQSDTAQIGWACANGVPVAPVPPPPTLAEAQASAIAAIGAAYRTAIAQPVQYTTQAGVAHIFQADPGSVANLQASLAGFAGATPAGFYWVAQDNSQILFAYGDLQGLAAAMMQQGWAAFQRLQTLKNQVRTATTVDAVQAVAW